MDKTETARFTKEAGYDEAHRILDSAADVAEGPASAKSQSTGTPVPAFMPSLYDVVAEARQVENRTQALLITAIARQDPLADAIQGLLGDVRRLASRLSDANAGIRAESNRLIDEATDLSNRIDSFRGDVRTFQNNIL